MMDTIDVIVHMRQRRAEIEREISQIEAYQGYHDPSDRDFYLSHRYGMLAALTEMIVYVNNHDTRLADEMRRQQGQPS